MANKFVNYHDIIDIFGGNGFLPEWYSLPDDPITSSFYNWTHWSFENISFHPDHPLEGIHPTSPGYVPFTSF